MSSKKKTVTQKAPPVKAKYKIGTKVFFINYLIKSREILEGEITSVQSEEYPERDNLGKIRGYTTLFYYVLATKRGELEQIEYNLFPSYQPAANEFAKAFLVLLK